MIEKCISSILSIVFICLFLLQNFCENIYFPKKLETVVNFEKMSNL